jgi:acetyl-CoA carboxylase biotin carboxyl carrier protein
MVVASSGSADSNCTGGANRHAILAAHFSHIAYPTMARIEIKSEITGTVWQVKAKPGDKVESGDTLVVIESMKMEIPVITEDAGTVKEILVKEKDPVAEGQVVAVIDG